MSEDSPQKYPDGFVSVSVVPREIGKVIYADRWQAIAGRLQKRDTLDREYEAALESGAAAARVADISSRLSAAKAAVRPEWVRLLIAADHLMTSNALPLYRHRRDNLPDLVARDRFAGDTEQHVCARQTMLLTGKAASDPVIVLERDLREALRLLDPIKKREHAMEGIEETYRSTSKGHQWHPKGLTPQQVRVLNELEEAAEAIRWWGGTAPKDDVEEQHQLEDQARYKTTLTRAVGAELWGHPIVREWLAARRSLGDWDGLRRFRKGLERDVNKPMLKADFWLAFEAQGLIDDEDEHGPEAIRKVLIEKLKNPESKDQDMWRDYFDLHPEDIERLTARLERSRQNFHKWLKRLRLI